MSYDAIDEVPTTQVFVPAVTGRVLCERHGANLFDPCFEFQSIISDRWIGGICNARARAAKMTGYINPRSLIVRRTA